MRLVWGKCIWRQLSQAIFVLDRNDHIAYNEYVTDQLREPDYAAPLQAVQQTAVK
jgi:peroxiredoxin